jgi:asparagine synthetase B (glutamine-hydrolysing)
VGADSLALSGGFDSVSLAILAAEQRDGRKPLHAVSLRFAPHEVDTQLEVARTLGMPQILQTIEESLDGDTIVHAALVESGVSWSPVLSPWQAMYTGLLRSARRHGLERLLMGTGGDDILTVDLSYGRDLLRACDLRGLWRFYRAWQRCSPFSASRVARTLLWTEAIAPEGRSLAKAFLRRVTPHGYDWLRAHRLRAQRPLVPPDRDLATALEERRRHGAPVAAVPGEGAYVRTLRYLTQAPLLLLELDQAYIWARHQGFTLLVPYFDQDLVGLTLRTHPEVLIAGGRVKAQLRRLVAERLPSVTMPSKKVDFTQMVHAVLRSAGRDVWQNLGGATRLAELGIVEPRRLKPLLDDYLAERHNNWVAIWRILSTETWLRARSCGRCTPRRELGDG